jgi:hypothetical protein
MDADASPGKHATKVSLRNMRWSSYGLLGECIYIDGSLDFGVKTGHDGLVAALTRITLHILK